VPNTLLRGPIEPKQYTSEQFTVALAEHDILASMGSVGDAYDNSMAESLVDTFKTELVSDRVWRTRAQLEIAIARWVGWYNNTRLHSALGDLPPVEFETAHELEQILQLHGSRMPRSPWNFVVATR
jgi:transposase InsO family protein